MITENLTMRYSKRHHWQDELRLAIRDPAQLIELLELSPHHLPPLSTSCRFSLCVPHSYVARMKKGDPYDPLLRQVLPTAQEQQCTEGFSTDPVGDGGAEKIPGLLHKYQGRVLLITTTACAIHCRFCFRQYYTYSKKQCMHNMLEMIHSDSSITEVILSGGDPLTLPDEHLAKLALALAAVPHLKRLRIHSRLPIVLPSRVNEELLAWLTATRLQSVVVVHANHANEIDESVGKALQELVNAGVSVLNQSVLLRGVNDTVPALVDLSEVLFQHRVLPYYLHHLDRVQGASHFEVPLDEASELLEQLRLNLPGYLVPKWVQEIAGLGYKKFL